jgi:hypothetical protein
MESKIQLTRDLKIRLLKEIQDGFFDIDAFPELQINTPRIYYVPASSLTPEQLEQFIANRQDNELSPPH